MSLIELHKKYVTFLLLLFSAIHSYGQCAGDTTPPIITCPANLTIDCPHKIGIQFPAFQTAITPTTSDNCAVTLQTYTLTGATNLSSNATGINDASVEIFLAGTTTVTYYIEDAAGNSTSCAFTVTVTDSNPPTINCPGDILQGNDPGQCYARITQTDLGFATAFDNCNGLKTSASGIALIDAPGSQPDYYEFPIGTTIVTWTITDLAGNSSTCLQEVIITDNENPTITCPSNITVNTAAGQCDAYINIPTVIANDNCSIVSITNDYNSGGANASDTFPIGTTTITFTTTDTAGLTSSCSVDVTVVNNQPPVITLLGSNPQTIASCNSYTELGATAIDTCLGDVTSDIIIDASELNTNVVGTYNVVYTVNGDPATQVIRSVNIIDTTSPILTLTGPNPMNIGDCSTYTELGAIASDCSGNLSASIVVDNSNVDTSTTGTYIVTYNVSDASGNAATQITRTINVVDVSGPDITLIGANPQVIEACDSYTELGATALDPCFNTDFTGDIVIDASSVDTSKAGTYYVTYNVTDTASPTPNAAIEMVREVIVNLDTEAPTVACLNITVTLDPTTGLATINPADIDNGSTDNCSVNFSLSQTNFDCSHIGNNTVTLTVTDDAGNSSFCSANVLVTDITETASTTISASDTQICLGESITFTATSTDGGSAPTYQWQINGLDVSGEITSTFTTTSLTDGDIVTVVMTSNLSVCAQPVTSNPITITINSFDTANAGPDFTNSICTDTTITLAGNPAIATDSTGLWTVTSGQVSGFSFSDPTSPTSTFTGDIGEVYTLTWSIDNPSTCPDSSDSMTVTFIGCNALDFDGIDDNITFRKKYDLTGNFTIEVWIKSETSNANIQTIISKRDHNNLVNGYDLSLTNNYISFNWNNGESLASPYPIKSNKWHHIAVTFNNGNYTLYIDGVTVANKTGVIPTNNNLECIVGAMDQTLSPPFKPTNYFDGGMDELRIWNVALGQTDIQKMMNQEITNNSGNVKGSFTPNNIGSLLWSNLSGYYRMNQDSDISNGNLLSNSATSINGTLRYMTTNQSETAPIPYKSTNDGDWTDTNTWLFGSVQNIPNSIGVDGNTKIDWNIVRTAHNVSSGNNSITLLALDIESNTLAIQNSNPADGQSLQVTDYLLINGTLDLVGESQLLQPPGSILDYTGTGYLERDQQGTGNKFNYNYWGSPVSTAGNATNRTYDLASIISNATSWTPGLDGNASPLTISTRWLYVFDNKQFDDYDAWTQINQNTAINAGLGYTMKGAGATNSADQNYIFRGQPNNGVIQNSIGGGTKATLIGNPYPSAIDANLLIIDNQNALLDGTLTFWEQAPNNNSHNLSQYQGRYSYYNLSGGLAPTTPPEINSQGNATKIPQRYIPVGQGFFVNGDADGGNIIFKNSQRIFIKETSGNSIFFEANNGENSEVLRTSENTSDEETNTVQRLRFTFKTPEGAIRHLLLAFTTDNKATDGFDYGYDGLNSDDFPSDLSFIIEGKKYVIQGVGEFDTNKRYPLSMVLGQTGPIEIALNESENFDEAVNVFIYDALLDRYTKLNAIDFSANLDTNTHDDRFYITFKDNQEALSIIEEQYNHIKANYLHDSKEIFVRIPQTTNVKQIYLINIAGQVVKSWNTLNFPNTNNFKIPVKNISEGTYILKLQSDFTTLNKKIIITD